MAIESIINQSFVDFELLIIDDGSFDRSREVALRYESVDQRIKVRSRKNRGLVATRNELVEWAQCEWIVWMDADDISEKDRLKTQYEFISSNDGYVCVGAFAQCIDPFGNNINIEEYPKYHQEVVRLQMLGGGMRFPTTIMRKSVVVSVGGFRGDFRMGEDLDLLIRMGEQGQLANIECILYFYRQHLKSTVAMLGSRWTVCRSLIIELASERRTSGSDRLQRGEVIVIDWASARVSRRDVSNTYSRWAFYCKKNGNYKFSIRYSILSLLNYPFYRRAWVVCASALFGLFIKSSGLRL
jgi:glycosyltransferase involved in cell wall biosynthesis